MFLKRVFNLVQRRADRTIYRGYGERDKDRRDRLIDERPLTSAD